MTLSPSVSSRFSRASGAASATSRTVSVSAWPRPSPSRSRWSTSAHTNAESVLASSDSSSAGESAVVSGARLDGQPRTAPLWLNSQGPEANGAAAASPSDPDSVASRTAASTAPLLTTLARSTTL